MNFTYQFPDAHVFLYTIQRLIDIEKDSEAASALIGVDLDFNSYGQYSRARWNSYDATLILRAPVTSIPKFTDRVKQVILNAAVRTMPQEAGYELSDLQISPALISPVPESNPLNTGSLVSQGIIEHDGLRFRSRTETRVYDELKIRDVLFFPNATAVLGGKSIKREPDFLICQNGRWGILEVMGDQYHTPANAMQDHDRARLFKDYKILLIEFYDARDCYDNTKQVVDDFLRRLESI